jgi:hypothetical protein
MLKVGNNIDFMTKYQKAKGQKIEAEVRCNTYYAFL